MAARSVATFSLIIAIAAIGFAAHTISQATANSIASDGLTVTIGGREMRCGQTPVYIDDEIPTEGMSVPGEGVILNPYLLSLLPEKVRMFIFKHECAHEITGPDELGADCIAAQSGAREGWLTAGDIDAVCRSFAGPATDTHPSGRERCAHIRRCFAGSQVAGAASPSGKNARASSWSAAGRDARDLNEFYDDSWPAYSDGRD